MNTDLELTLQHLKALVACDTSNLNKIKTKSESQEAQPKQEKRKNLINRRRKNTWVNDW